MHLAGLAGYDVILGMPTLCAGDAVISVRGRTIHFKEWGVTMECSPHSGPTPWREKSPAPPAQLQPEISTVTVSDGSVATSDNTSEIAVKVTVTEPTNVQQDGNGKYYQELLEEEFKDILVDQLPNKLPPLREINHSIPFHPKTVWAAHKYRLPEAHKSALEGNVDGKLKAGIIRYSSDIPLAASHMVPKKDGAFRYVQDLRKRNADTDTLAWPMPDQEELVHKIARSSNASVFDLISAFDQTRIEPESEKYATIINHMGVMQQRVIQQGDKNAVAT